MSVQYDPEPRTYLSLWRGVILAPSHRWRTMRSVIALAAERHGVEPSDITGPRRFKRIVLARQEAMYLARCVRRHDGSARYSLPFIGQHMGERDHTTVMHGIRAHARRNDLAVPA